MKILHLLYESKGDYFGIGGVGMRAYKIYNYLKQRHEITLLCKKYPGAKDKEIEGIKHIFVGIESKSLTITLLAYAKGIREFVYKKGTKYDIIIEEFSPAIPSFLHTFKEVPVILQIQGFTGMKYFQKYNLLYSSVLYILERFRPKFYKKFIFVSEAAKKRFSLPKNVEISVISNGIDKELLNLSTYEDGYFLYLGRIDIHHKGLDILLKAYNIVLKKYPWLRLKIAGDGRDRNKFLLLLDKFGLKNNVEFLGWTEETEKKDILRKAMFIVVPSRYETQAIVVLEAAAVAKAVIVSNINELKYIVEAGGGISFHTEDPYSLAEKICLLIENNQLRKILGKRGKQWVKQYTWKRIAEQYEKFLDYSIKSTVFSKK